MFILACNVPWVLEFRENSFQVERNCFIDSPTRPPLPAALPSPWLLAPRSPLTTCDPSTTPPYSGCCREVLTFPRAAPPRRSRRLHATRGVSRPAQRRLPAAAPLHCKPSRQASGRY